MDLILWRNDLTIKWRKIKNEKNSSKVRTNSNGVVFDHG